jgi:CheY-like chemotaxis protein
MMANVLVIDDDEYIREMSRAFIEILGHTAVTASNGKEAEAALQTGKFDVVLTDLDLPGMSGWEIAKMVKAAAPTARVGLISGHDTGLSKQALATKGVDFVLGKPFSMSGLEDILSTLPAKK